MIFYIVMISLEKFLRKCSWDQSVLISIYKYMNRLDINIDIDIGFVLYW